MGDEVPAREGEAEAGGEWLSLRDAYDVFHRYCKKYNLPATKQRRFNEAMRALPLLKKSTQASKNPKLYMKVRAGE
jgi:hypothetical protein